MAGTTHGVSVYIEIDCTDLHVEHFPKLKSHMPLSNPDHFIFVACPTYLPSSQLFLQIKDEWKHLYCVFELPCICHYNSI